VWSPTRNVCVYTFTVRRSQPPGTYWYHAHLHGISDIQVGGGLAGALIVVPEKPDPSAVREDGDVVLLVKNAARTQTGGLPAGGPQAMSAMSGMMGHGAGDAVQTRHYGALAAKVAGAPAPAPAASPIPFDPFSPPPWTSGWPLSVPLPPYCQPIATDATAGVQALAVNGALIPATYGSKTYPSAGPTVTQPLGTIYRYRVINAASDSFINVRTVTPNGTTVNLNVVARDGVPVDWNKATASVDHSKPSIVREPNVFVPPSGRVDILVPGTSTPLRIISVPGTPTPTSPSGTPYCTGYLGDAMPQRMCADRAVRAARDAAAVRRAPVLARPRVDSAERPVPVRAVDPRAPR
jgi:FtsP/CotA-like multicopper oxidase with cupredoxin domain